MTQPYGCHISPLHQPYDIKPKHVEEAPGETESNMSITADLRFRLLAFVEETYSMADDSQNRNE